MNDLILTTASDLSNLIYDQVCKALAAHQPTPAPVADPERWMNLQELCEYLPEKPKRGTVYTWVQYKLIPNSKKGKRLYFLKSEVDNWLKSGRRKTFAEIQAEAERGSGTTPHPGGDRRL